MASSCSKELPSRQRWKAISTQETCASKLAKDTLSASAIGVLCSGHPAHKQNFLLGKGDNVALSFCLFLGYLSPILTGASRA
jgi:hypothetical protein